MTNTIKAIGILIAGLAVGWLVSVAVHGSNFGGVYNNVTNYFRDGISVGTSGQWAITSGGVVTNTGSSKLGSSGTTLTELIATTCTLTNVNASQAASSTHAVDCAVTGVTSSHTVIAELSFVTGATSCGLLSNCWSIVGAKASTTAGWVTVLLKNDGPAAVPSATSVGSTTRIWAWK